MFHEKQYSYNKRYELRSLIRVHMPYPLKYPWSSGIFTLESALSAPKKQPPFPQNKGTPILVINNNHHSNIVPFLTPSSIYHP